MAHWQWEWTERAARHQWLEPKGCIGLFPCQSEGDDVIIYRPEDVTRGDATPRTLARLHFDLLAGGDGTDAFSPAQFFLSRESGRMDVAGVLIATAGMRSQEVIRRFQSEGDSESAHLLQGLADRTAEDLAAMLHDRLRATLRVAAGYGARYSPGYPGLAITFNRFLYDLLEAEKLDIGLTEAFQFIPTSTTAAVVCFHPAAGYA